MQKLFTMYKFSFLLHIATSAAYSWVSSQPGVDTALLKEHHVRRAVDSCPFNADHKPAAPYNPKYRYTGAANGVPGNGIGGLKVPADGDEAHYYQAPGPNDIRGPCPGLNAAANHNFLAHDGIVTFKELVDAQQNVYNVGYDLAVLLAVFAIQQDGDFITERLSIGCDATSRTSSLLSIGREPGLNGHNKFEGDTSLTRNDYFVADGDNYSFNGTLFADMKSYADNISGGLFDRKALIEYRAHLYDKSVHENPNFFFGPGVVLLYGAASFLYELFPNFGDEGPADLEVISSFFGAQQDSSAPGGWAHIPERIPDNWMNRRKPFTAVDVVTEILALYLPHPKLIGGNAGIDNFNALNSTFDIIKDGKLPDDVTTAQVVCFLYQLAVNNIPNALSSVTDVLLDALDWSAGKLNPVFKNAGCALRPVF
ncbi:unnamed protein product [Periconia digitata]|uniref:Heme haloperoxidase family profile domain-containing protein n=1 Tax=Periconia digitata TaxID=1303443 RepID=A0A9W4XL27_9PLEO|nr:unnamed protein product [Periconia digitata]